VFGHDYDTPDGTCIRDYVHVLDLCQAHTLAARWLMDGGASSAFNLGNGNGYSVLEVIEAVERVTGRPIPLVYGPRRAGDPARLVADAKLIREQLGWTPRCPEIEMIVRHAWGFEVARH
jgi:UDP-glucose 4-epimerase